MDDQQRKIECLTSEVAELRARLATIEAEDVAKRKRFEEVLEAFEKSYKEIFNAVSTGICVHEMSTGRIVDANQAMIDMFGYSREEMSEWDFWEQATIGPPYDAQSAIELVKKAALGESKILQWPVRRCNGEEFWVEATLKQAVIGGSPCVISLLNDITDRRHAEQALKENDRKLSSAVSIAKLGYWEYDVATDLFTFDDHFYAIFRTTAEAMGGYTMSPERYAESFLFPEDAHLLSKEMQRAMETDDPHFSRQTEHRIRYVDGETGYIAVRYHIVKDQHGRTIKTYGANQDITDRRRTEEALRASEQNYREIFNASISALFVHEIPSGRILDVNQTVLDMFGCSREEALQMSFWKTVSAGTPYSPAEALRLIRKAAGEGQQSVQWPVHRKNGEEFWVEVVVRPAAIGGIPRVLALMNDVTDRRRSEEALKASERNYREIFNASMNSIALVDVNTGRFVDVNPAMLALHGLSRDEALHLTVADISADQSCDERQRGLDFLKKAVTEGPQKFERLCKAKDGRLFWAEVAMREVTIDGKQYVLAVASDITDRKEARQRLIEEQQTLRQLLESQERERRLIAFEIHDGIAQQMAAAAMYCSTFERLQESNPEEAMKSHEAGAIMLQKALAETRRLIRGLRPAVLDESGLIAAIESLGADLCEGEGIEVEFVHDVRFDRLGPVLENSLFRIVQESLTNAARYSKSKKIHISLVEQSNRLILQVTDWGCGFDPNSVGSDRFGLKGIRERASLLGGEATIDSKSGEGTRIHVELPLDNESAQ